MMDVVETKAIPTRRLDDIEEARRTDLLKLDVQGAELDVLAHGTETLKHVDIVEVEVVFLPLYEDQPLFADIDGFLRKQRFDFHTFLGFANRRLVPLTGVDGPQAGAKQILWSDAVYVKSPNRSSEDPDPGALLKRAVLLHELYQSQDFAARALRDYDRLTGHDAFEACYPLLCEPRAA